MNQQHQFTQNRAIPAHMLSSAMHPNMTSMQQMHQQHNVMVCGPSATPSATNISISNPSMVSHSYQQQQPPPQMVHQMPTNVNPQQQPNPQPQTHQPAPQFVNVPVSSAPVAHNTQSATIASISSATEGPTEVVGRLKMLTEKMLRASIMKVLDTAAMSVNNQGGRDNGTADVMSSTGSSATSDKDSVSSLNSKYSNVPLAQDVEESMMPTAKRPKIKKDAEKDEDVKPQMSVDGMNPIITSWLAQMGEESGDNGIVPDSVQINNEGAPGTNGGPNELNLMGCETTIDACVYPGSSTYPNSSNSNTAESFGSEVLPEKLAGLRKHPGSNSLSSRDLEKLKSECAQFKEMLDLVVRDLIRLQDSNKITENKTIGKEKTESRKLELTDQDDGKFRLQVKEEKQNISPFSLPIKQEPNYGDCEKRVQPLPQSQTSTDTMYPASNSSYILEAPFSTIKREEPDEEDSSITGLALSELLQQSDSTSYSNEHSESGASESEGLVLSDNWFKPRRNNSRAYAYRPVKRETNEEVVVEYLRSVRDGNMQVEYDVLISDLDLSSIETCCDSLMKLHNLSSLRQGKLYHRVAKGKVIATLRKWIDNDKDLTQILKSRKIFIENAQRRNFVRVYNLFLEHSEIVNYDATLTYVLSNFAMIKGILKKGLLSDQYELYPSPEKYMQLIPTTSEEQQNKDPHTGSLELPKKYTQSCSDAHLVGKEFGHHEY